MRTQTVDAVTVTYPDEYIWLGDYNQIRFDFDSSTYETLSVNIIMSTTDKSYTIYNTTERDTLVFDISDTVRRLYDEYEETDITVQFVVVKQQSYVTFQSFHLKTNVGKSLSSHSHSYEEVVYFKDSSQLETWENFYLGNATLYVNDTSIGSVGAGLNSIDLSDYIDEFTLKIVYSSTKTQFDILNGNHSGATYYIKFKKVCGDIITYRNSDGANRYLVGKITSIETQDAATEYTRRSFYNKEPFTKVNSTSYIVNFVTSPVEYKAYVQDILLNDQVLLNGVTGTVVDNNIAINRDITEQVELKIKVQR